MCHFPDHIEFVRRCRDAEAEAQRTGKKANFWWRGYRGTVAANLPRISVQNLEIRLMNALNKISSTSVPEKMVRKNRKKIIQYNKKIL